MGWMVRGSNCGGGIFFHTCSNQPWGPPSLLYNGYRVFPGLKSSQGITPHPLLVPWSRRSGVIPLLPLWAVWPVRSLSACTRVLLQQRIVECLNCVKMNVLQSLQFVYCTGDVQWVRFPSLCLSYEWNILLFDKL